ncbi:MAG: cob(I)yrinic acid a,c-diamide adenosyltransferase [Promethearchaeota archaeon]
MKKGKESSHKGMVQVYTGSGKGKTTAALGLGLRAAGHGFEVYMIQFMKGKINYGELNAVKYIPNFTIRQFGRPDFVDKSKPDAEDVKLAKAALAHAREIIERGTIDFLILDEVNVAMDFGLVTEQEVIALIESRPAHMELVLTGRYAPASIIELADLVSEVREVKHPYQKGVAARKGVEM